MAVQILLQCLYCGHFNVTNLVYQVFILKLGKMIIFGSLLTTFEVSCILRGIWGCSENWLESKFKLSSQACLKPLIHFLFRYISEGTYFIILIHKHFFSCPKRMSDEFKAFLTATKNMICCYNTVICDL